MKGLRGWQSRNAVTAIRIHRWVFWWFYVGVVCGVVALVNILFRDLTRTQERMILILGILHWCVGGLICWAFDGIRVEEIPPQKPAQPAIVAPEKEWHAASEFRLPGSGQALLRPFGRRNTRETIAHYAAQQHREQQEPKA